MERESEREEKIKGVAFLGGSNVNRHMGVFTFYGLHACCVPVSNEDKSGQIFSFFFAFVMNNFK